MLELVIGCTFIGAFIMLSFIVGLHYGSKVKNNEEIDIPKPIKSVSNSINEIKESKRTSKEQEIMDINLANIDAYDGTELGQKDIPI